MYYKLIHLESTSLWIQILDRSQVWSQTGLSIKGLVESQLASKSFELSLKSHLITPELKMDIEHQLLFYVVIIPQVILWLLVAVVLLYKYFSRNQGVSILDEECPEPAIELEEPQFTPFGGRAFMNQEEKVFSISRTLGASGFVMEDILALSTTGVKPGNNGAHATSMSSNGCSLLEDVLAMRTMENSESKPCSLLTSQKKDSSSSLSSFDNTRSSDEDVFGSDDNDSYSRSWSSSSSTSPQEGKVASSRNRMTSTPRCPQELLRDAFVTVRTNRPSARKVLLHDNMPSQIESSEAVPSAIAVSSDICINISDQSSLVTSTTGPGNFQRATLTRSSFGNSSKYSIRTSFRAKQTLLKDTLLQCGIPTVPVHSSLTKSSSTYHKFDDCDQRWH